MATPEPYHEVKLTIVVHHKQEYESYGNNYGVPGVIISVLVRKAFQENYLPVTAGTTMANGAFMIGLGFKDNEFPVEFKFELRKDGYTGINEFEVVMEPGDYTYKYYMEEIDWAPHPDDKEDISMPWEAQPWQDRLAYSFIISLAIILTFKMLQGFSMERVNPVA